MPSPQHSISLRGGCPAGATKLFTRFHSGSTRPPCSARSFIVFPMPKSSPKKPHTIKARVLSSREVYKGPAFRVTADEVLEPSGVRTRRDIVHHSGSVGILAVRASRYEPRVLLERQYRHAARQLLWELPAGRIDEGESGLTAAKRELLEETGYTASGWRCIVRFYASPGFLA